MILINLTPHDINVLENGVIKTYPATGDVARVDQINQPNGTVNDAPVNRPTYGAVEGLPLYQKAGMYYIVSALVRQSQPHRKDLLSPDSGATAVRDEKGLIKYVTGWLSN